MFERTIRRARQWAGTAPYIVSKSIRHTPEYQKAFATITAISPPTALTQRGAARRARALPGGRGEGEGVLGTDGAAPHRRLWVEVVGWVGPLRCAVRAGLAAASRRRRGARCAGNSSARGARRPPHETMLLLLGASSLGFWAFRVWKNRFEQKPACSSETTQTRRWTWRQK